MARQIYKTEKWCPSGATYPGVCVCVCYQCPPGWTFVGLLSGGGDDEMSRDTHGNDAQTRASYKLPSIVIVHFDNSSSTSTDNLSLSRSLQQNSKFKPDNDDSSQSSASAAAAAVTVSHYTSPFPALRISADFLAATTGLRECSHMHTTLKYCRLTSAFLVAPLLMCYCVCMLCVQMTRFGEHQRLFLQ